MKRAGRVKVACGGAARHVLMRECMQTADLRAREKGGGETGLRGRWLRRAKAGAFL